jgi:hypothetical protein
MVCQNLELREGFNFLLLFLETRSTLTNEGLHPPTVKVQDSSLHAHWLPILVKFQEGSNLVQIVKIQCHLMRGLQSGFDPETLRLQVSQS